MTSNSPLQNDDDWQIVDPDSVGQPEGAPSGAWEGEGTERAPRTAARPARAQRPVAAAPAAGLFANPATRPFLLLAGAGLIGLCALGCLLAGLLLYSSGGTDRVGGLFRPSAADLAATQPAQRPVTDTVNVQVNGTPVPPGIPTRISLGNRVFDVLPLQINDSREWKYDVNNKRAAYWAAGTLVNVVIGLQANTDNKALYAALTPGDLITLDSAAGVQRYRIADKTQIDAADLALLSNQSSPRLTLVMLGESGEQRSVLVAQYTDEGTPNQPVALGAIVNLGDARMSAIDSRLVPGGSAGLSEGRNFYQVNLRVTNITTRVLDATQFFAELSDGGGNRYQSGARGRARPARLAGARARWNRAKP